MLEDYSQRQPIATWNPARGVWETSQVNLLCGHLELWSDPWPQSGIAVNGQVFELPMQEHHTTDSEYSSLPTPAARDFRDGSKPHERDGVVQTDTVARAVFNSGEVQGTDWGKFATAIKRWEEVLGRPAPAPTKPDGKDGAHRLSSAFTEWMMGLEPGWVTGNGLSRNDELKMCGNGVVPAQAELALRILLEGVALPKAGGV